MSASKQLHHWKAETEKCRRECAELAFFSNEKVMRILRILQSSRPSSVDLVKEIACLYNSDQETIRKLTLAIQVKSIYIIIHLCSSLHCNSTGCNM